MSTELAFQYQKIRAYTLSLTKNLRPEDTVVQPIEDVSPVKWHLAHTTWFFENFILAPYLPEYTLFHKNYGFLFNSYYNSQGNRVARDLRGFQTRPGWADIQSYRAYVDEAMDRLFAEVEMNDSLLLTIQVGLNHEQQHQELLITDTKYILSLNVMDSPMLEHPLIQKDNSPEGWIHIPEGIREIGHQGAGFCFDNELPRHRIFQNAVEISRRPVLVSDYLEFMADGGYNNPLLWLSDGWAWKEKHAIESPLYWENGDEGRKVFTTAGWKLLDMDWPICHISYYEADAFARWAGARLCTEAERELIDPELTSNQCWEWTSSAYSPYPGYQSWADALGEYNGKFMVNQMVLKGGSVATPKGHYRASYRNFFHPDKQWQFSGIRLAKDLL
jgi:ergothioneine biosynthesis protein EgtB